MRIVPVGTLTAFLAALRADKVPYGLTVLFVIWGWTITHVVEDVRERAGVVYDIDISEMNDQAVPNLKKATVRVENLTRDKTFQNFVVRVSRSRAKDDVEFLTRPGAFSLRYGGSRSPESVDADGDSEGVEYRVSDLSPGTYVVVTAIYKGFGLPIVTGRSDLKETLYFAKSGWLAILARYESQVLIFFALVATAIIGYSLFPSNSSSAQT